MHQITSHLKTLKVMLPKIIEGGSLSNILDQCMLVLDSHRWVHLPAVGFPTNYVLTTGPPSSRLELVRLLWAKARVTRFLKWRVKREAGFTEERPLPSPFSERITGQCLVGLVGSWAHHR
ncbi:hypothetical protein SAY86_026896 [Trapa natans]|uniref:Uncharacterized protein n=1 Tax=Trapa natans TaxID=22666 RepID=A0AAN7KK74_TRANT|nr:hypothetical protein SAY86_026896 [Trapa natans]